MPPPRNLLAGYSGHDLTPGLLARWMEDHDVGYERASILPLRRNLASGEREFAWPGMLRGPVQSTVNTMAYLNGQRDLGIEDVVGVTGMMATGGVGGLLGGAIPRNALGATGSKMLTIDHYGQPIRVFRNARPEALARFLGATKHKAARRLTDKSTGDVYVWDAADPAIHPQMVDQLGLNHKMVDADVIGLDD